ncbi:MAG: aminotransferase class V-fold PLP-dependent enzyme, partial [Cellvibrionales bacterium TMED148]
MPDLDVEFSRSQFPAFTETTLENFIHIENAGGTYACEQTITALTDFYKKTKVQPYYGFEPSHKAGQKMSLARTRLASWLNVLAEEVHFGPSTSQNTYVVAQALQNYLVPKDEIIVTNQDHEANIGAWRKLETAGVAIKEWQINVSTGELETNDLVSLLNENTRFVAFTHCSNIVGSINPAQEWIKLIHDAGALALVDGVSYVGHGFPDIRELGADMYFFSLYKVYGPHLGVMFIKDDLNQTMPNQGHYFNHDVPIARFTPSGPDHAQIASVNGVIDYFESVYNYHYDDIYADDRLKSKRVNHLFKKAEKRNMIPLL